MRTLILVIFCCITAITKGQSLFFNNDSAYARMIDLPGKEPFDTAHPYNRVEEPYLYIISNKDLFDLFGYDRASKMRDFNFEEHHILGQQVCVNCFLHCKHGIEGTGLGCHRNRCSYAWKWTVRDNKKAFEKIHSTTLAGHDENSLPEYLYRDTTIIKNENNATWYTTGGGDCHAKHVYEIYSDRFYPNLLLKEFNHNGGCRAGGWFKYAVSFKMPPGHLSKIKRTILLDKYK